MDIVLNQPLLPFYRCFDTFSFLFSGNLILFLWSDILVLRLCIDSMYTSFHLLLLCSLNLYLL